MASPRPTSRLPCFSAPPPLSISFGVLILSFFFFNDTATPEIYPLPLHDALPIWVPAAGRWGLVPRPTHPGTAPARIPRAIAQRSERHTSELQSLASLVYRPL